MNASALRVAPDPRLERDFVTPEGMALRLSVASAGTRATAFAIDAAIIVGALIAMTLLLLLAGWALGRGPSEWVFVLWLLGFFFGRNAYFLFFELGQRAATPGKRMSRIRVAARDGERLAPDAVIARNLLREVEVFLPLSFLAASLGGGDAGGLPAIAGLAWAGLFLTFPLLNRDRLRCGDLVAGTWVVRDPRRRLGRVLVEAAPPASAFSDAELQAYGAYELHTLEDVLRREDGAAAATVARAIAGKIGREEPADARAFLHAYYGALKARLERDLLMGKRKRDKHDA